MKKFFRYFPPTYSKPGRRSNNGALWIYVGRDENCPAATYAQERREWGIGWRVTWGPFLLGLIAGIAGAVLQANWLIVFGGLVAALSIGIGISKPMRAYRGIRGQVTEACAAAWLYDHPLDAEIGRAALQLSRGDYPDLYGLKGKSLEEIEEICWDLVDGESQWVSDNRKLLTDARDWLES